MNSVASSTVENDEVPADTCDCMDAEHSHENPLLLSTNQPSSKGVARPKRSWRTFFRDILLYLGIYLLVSGLTIGPFFWTWFGAVYADGPKWIARAYMPLLFLCEIFPPLGRLINAWVNWWIL